MIFVDTGYLFAISSPRDELHARALQWASAVAEPLLTTEYVHWELTNGLSSPADRPQCHLMLDNIYNSRDWEVVAGSDEWTSAGLALHRQYFDKAWSLTDCISFLVMRQRHVSRALTHDRHFEQAGFEALLRHEAP